MPRLARSAAPSKMKWTWDDVPRWALFGGIGILVIGGVIAAIVGLRRGSEKTPVIAPATTTAQPAETAAPAPSEDQAAVERVIAARKAMRSAAEAREWGRGADALVTLVAIAPSSFDDRVVALDTLAIATGIEVGGGERAAKVFDALETKLGSTGLDLLYEIVSTRGGSKASQRAADILRKKDVKERASPALQIAIDLRDASSCQERLGLLERARTQGDTRAVAVLDNLRQLECIAKAGECCFKTNPAVADTIKQIWARVRTSP